MITMSTYTVYEYLKQKFPELSAILKNGNIDKRLKKALVCSLVQIQGQPAT